LGWLISIDQNLLIRIGNGLGNLFVVLAIFAFGSIEGAPLDALAEGRNPENPISKGYLTISFAWKICLILAGIGLLISALISTRTLLVNLGILIVGMLYFHHALRLRQSILLDALGFSILTSLLPFISAANLSSVHFGKNSLVTGGLAFFLAYACYFSMIAANAKNMTGASPRLRLSGVLLIIITLILLASFYVFLFSGLVPTWVSVLILVLLLILLHPQSARRKAILHAQFAQRIFGSYLRALTIALVTFYLATQIFSIIR
jgi:4-hydroxybenzoate polyprenyltransferase